MLEIAIDDLSGFVHDVLRKVGEDRLVAFVLHLCYLFCLLFIQVRVPEKLDFSEGAEEFFDLANLCGDDCDLDYERGI